MRTCIVQRHGPAAGSRARQQVEVSAPRMGGSGPGNQSPFSFRPTSRKLALSSSSMVPAATGAKKRSPLHRPTETTNQRQSGLATNAGSSRAACKAVERSAVRSFGHPRVAGFIQQFPGVRAGRRFARRHRGGTTGVCLLFVDSGLQERRERGKRRGREV